MSQTEHIEKHFTSGETIRDIVIGMSDGLTVPFALAAGLSGAIASTNIIVTAGLAEVAAGAVAMGLGGYLASRSDSEHYANERLREAHEVANMPLAEEAEVVAIFRQYGLNEHQIASIVSALQANTNAWIDFMMKFELGLEKPEPTRARNSAITIAASYVTGGFIPLLPYMMTSDSSDAMIFSVLVTLVALSTFGYVKGRFTGNTPIRCAFQTTFIGGLAGTAAFLITKALA